MISRLYCVLNKFVCFHWFTGCVAQRTAVVKPRLPFLCNRRPKCIDIRGETVGNSTLQQAQSRLPFLFSVLETKKG
jgi:hypothetical protein